MYHIPGITAEARTVSEALGGKKPLYTLKYGPEERKYAYDQLNLIGGNTGVDFVLFGCPHNSIQEIQEICNLIKGRRLKDGVHFWVLTPRSIRDLADRNGFTKIINDFGGVLMADSCPALGRLMPKGAKVMATNSAKQGHYLPSIMGIEAWYGATEDCVNAAITGLWDGELK
jgi:predicted aconitase